MPTEDQSKPQMTMSIPQASKGSEITADQTQSISISNIDHFKMGESHQCSMLENNNSGALDSQAEYAPIKIEHSNELNDE